MTLADWIAALLLAPPCLALLASPFIVARFVAAIPRLADGPLPQRERWPSVSLVVPARNELHTLRAASASRLALDYPDLELLLVDDRSDDGSTELVDELAAADPRIVPVHVTTLPDGWLGKNHALHLGSQRARGEWLLFTDADVHLAPQTIRRAVDHAERNGLDMLAVLPDLDSEGFLLDCALAGFGRLFSISQRPWKVADPKSDAAMGVGAFNLVRRSALRRSDGLQWLAYEILDDLALGVLMKRSGARCAVASGRGLVSVAWYPDLRSMVVGLEKNTFPAAGCSFARLIVFAGAVAWLELSPYAALFVSGPAWLPWLAGAALLVGGVSAAAIARWMERPVLPALLTPIGTAISVLILLRAGWLGWRRGGVRWRGTFYPSALLRERGRVRF